MGNNIKIKAVGLISGGLDSLVSTFLMKEIGVEIHGIFFSLPWGCGDEEKAKKFAETLGIKLKLMKLDDEFLEIVKNPKHGRGTAMNPCIDCKIHMLQEAKKYMEEIKASFVYTGEVIWQRPMSQTPNSLRAIEKRSGLEGRLLRPLCAKLLKPTIPEEEELIDRDKLLRISGRSRREQYKLAEKYHLKNFQQPSGGCLLTDKNFSNRLKDLFSHKTEDINDVISLKWGRHFRINDKFKAIVGRDEKENEMLIKFAKNNDLVFQFNDKIGPNVILKGKGHKEDEVKIAAGLLQYFSKHKNDPPLDIDYWLASDKAKTKTIKAQPVDTQYIDKIKL